MHAIQKITDQITLVVLGVNIWSGRKKLRAEDLKLGTEMPPDELVSLGSKRVCNPEDLKVFHRIKKSAERACLSTGTRFLGGFAVANCHAEDVAEKLDALKVEFEAQTTAFLSVYDRALEEWIGTIPAWEEPIRRAVEPSNVVGGRLRFGFQLLQIAPADKPGTLAQEVSSLGEGIFAESALIARDLDDAFLGKDVLRRSALATFRRIREKLDCLSFVDRRIEPIVDTIDDWFGRLPDKGPIAGGIFNEGWAIATILGDPDKLARHGAGQLALAQVPPQQEQETEEMQPAQTQTDPDPEISIEDDLDAWFAEPDPSHEGAVAAQHKAPTPASTPDAEVAVDSSEETEQGPSARPLSQGSFFWDGEGGEPSEPDQEGEMPAGNVTGPTEPAERTSFFF